MHEVGGDISSRVLALFEQGAECVFLVARLGMSIDCATKELALQCLVRIGIVHPVRESTVGQRMIQK